MSANVTAWEALAVLSAAGVTVTADGGDLLVKPASRLTPDLVALARVHKPDLLALLAPGAWATAYPNLIPPGICHDCGGPASRDGMHWCGACRKEKGRCPTTS
jgi:hypothetical protein